MKRNNAVSPVIGAIVLVAITVIVSGVVGAYVFGITGDVQKTKLIAVVADKVNTVSSGTCLPLPTPTPTIDPAICSDCGNPGLGPCPVPPCSEPCRSGFGFCPASNQCHPNCPPYSPTPTPTPTPDPNCPCGSVAIVFTNHGGKDTSLLMDGTDAFCVQIDGVEVLACNGALAKDVGSSGMYKGHSGRQHVIVTGHFTDGTYQVLLDTWT